MEGTLVLCRGQLPPRAVVFTRSQGRMFLSTDVTWFLHPDPQRLHQRFSTYTNRKAQQNQPNPLHNPQNTDSKRWAGWKRCYEAIASQPQQHRFGPPKLHPLGTPMLCDPTACKLYLPWCFLKALRAEKRTVWTNASWEDDRTWLFPHTASHTSWRFHLHAGAQDGTWPASSPHHLPLLCCWHYLPLMNYLQCASVFFFFLFWLFSTLNKRGIFNMLSTKQHYACIYW